MTKHNLALRRVFAESKPPADDPGRIFADLRHAFEAFKAEHEQALADIRKGQEDVVRTEKVDRINAEVTSLQSALDQVNQTIALLQVGTGGSVADPAVAEHAQTFESWFRRGAADAEASLRDLQVRAAMTTDSDPDGGYLVPEQMATMIDRVMATTSVMRQIATVMPIGTDTYTKLVSQGVSAAGWVGERDARPETGTPTLRRLVFEAMELYANPAISQRALDDSRTDIARLLADEVYIDFGEQEGAAFITGDGVAKPRGITGYDKVANSSYAWGSLGYTVTGVAAALSDSSHNGADAMIDLYHSLRARYRNGAVWVMDDATVGSVRQFKDTNGAYLYAPPSASGELPTYLGKPVYTDENMPAVQAGAFPVAFGNFARGYLIVDRFGTRVLRDPFTNKPNVHFYTTKRVGGGVANFEAIKLLKVGTS